MKQIAALRPRLDRRSRPHPVWILIVLFACCGVVPPNAAGADFNAVQAIFNQHCVDCHGAKDPEGGLVMETHATLMKGGESGAVVLPGRADESLLVQMVEGRFEKDGRKKLMPPGKRKKLESADIATIKAWITAGAKAPVTPASKPAETLTALPRIVPKVPPRRAVAALAYAPGPRLLAVGRANEVELMNPETRQVVRTLPGHAGQVNALAFSSDGAWLYAASGEPGLSGEVRQWRVADGRRVRLFEGHSDAVYSLGLSPDGRLLATGSYDQRIHLWRIETVEDIATLSGHNGCVYALAFRPDGRLLASASADRTVKLWAMPGGERRDTLSQSLKELYSAAFSTDGKRLFSAGADNRIRMYEVSERASETTNPLLEARFGHESAILRLVISSDGRSIATSAEDRMVKIWDAATLTEKQLIPGQPDWAPALAFVLENKALAVGRLDGSLEIYETATGKPLPLPKPELVRIEPRGVQRGVPTRLKLTGRHLAGVTAVKGAHAGLSGEIEAGDRWTKGEGETWIRVTAAADVPPGGHELWLSGTHGESGRVRIEVDLLPEQVVPSGKSGPHPVAKLPVNLWGTYREPGDADEFTFEAQAGETLVFDVAARSLGSKADPVLTLADGTGRVLASSNGFDGSTDPFIAFTFGQAGRYAVRVHDLLLGASDDHFYRLTIGALPYVTGVIPLGVRAGEEAAVELIGHNLPMERRVSVKAGEPGEVTVPLDRERFRARRVPALVVSGLPETIEAEPNDQPAGAMRLTPPCAVSGRIGGAGRSGDVDLFAFEARAGERWILETEAAQRGSPVDTRIEVLDAGGRPVPRLLLQAVRNSAVTFRGIDSAGADCRVENWEEMELNQYLYLQGEVVRLFRAPQGPDSGFVFYTRNGKRRCYFDTSPTAHALDEPCYIVEPHPPGAKLVSNGLPVFPVNFENDDDAERRLGSDSRVHFIAPQTGTYLVRVTDTRGAAGDRYVYRLVARRPEPDFAVTLSPVNLTVNPGSGQTFTVSVERRDGFEGEVRVDLAGLPAGFQVSTPLVVQEGQTEARGTLFAAGDATAPADTASGWGSVVASASVDGLATFKAVNNFGRITLGPKPRLFVGLTAQEQASIPTVTVGDGGIKPVEVILHPGRTASAWLKLRRNGHDDLVTFTVENLPHGVIVDNIGLNGVLIPKGQDEREIFFSAARWVGETDRLCFAVENQAGRQTSVPVLLKVRKAPSATTAAVP